MRESGPPSRLCIKVKACDELTWDGWLDHDSMLVCPLALSLSLRSRNEDRRVERPVKGIRCVNWDYRVILCTVSVALHCKQIIAVEMHHSYICTSFSPQNRSSNKTREASTACYPHAREQFLGPIDAHNHSLYGGGLHVFLQRALVGHTLQRL